MRARDFCSQPCCDQVRDHQSSARSMKAITGKPPVFLSSKERKSSANFFTSKYPVAGALRDGGARAKHPADNDVAHREHGGNVADQSFSQAFPGACCAEAGSSARHSGGRRTGPGSDAGARPRPGRRQCRHLVAHRGLVWPDRVVMFSRLRRSFQPESHQRQHGIVRPCPRHFRPT